MAKSWRMASRMRWRPAAVPSRPSRWRSCARVATSPPRTSLARTRPSCHMLFSTPVGRPSDISGAWRKAEPVSVTSSTPRGPGISGAQAELKSRTTAWPQLRTKMRSSVRSPCTRPDSSMPSSASSTSTARDTQRSRGSRGAAEGAEDSDSSAARLRAPGDSVRVKVTSESTSLPSTAGTAPVPLRSREAKRSRKVPGAAVGRAAKATSREGCAAHRAVPA
mmetsp:Transcript_96437/g.269868  ORF Transcript_96437/g.269868 Transcript_96437/m.269868 type:complete len:221 (+) Transcript_96437:437-1099(+)